MRVIHTEGSGRAPSTAAVWLEQSAARCAAVLPWLHTAAGSAPAASSAAAQSGRS